MEFVVIWWSLKIRFDVTLEGLGLMVPGGNFAADFAASEEEKEEGSVDRFGRLRVVDVDEVSADVEQMLS